MILALLLVRGAEAASCCAGSGLAPTTLASCDGLGVGLGLGGDLQTGGWAWGGDWGPVGDDGRAEGAISVAGMFRASPWLQAGLRMPLTLTSDRLDGARTTELGLSNAGGWLLLETTPTQLGGRHLALELGLSGDTGEEGGLLGQVGLRAASRPGTWGLWGRAAGEIALLGEVEPRAEASLTVDRALGAKTRLGLGARARGAAGALPELETALGPSLTFAPSVTRRLQLSAMAGPPVTGLGFNAASRLLLSMEWVEVLRPWPKAD